MKRIDKDKYLCSGSQSLNGRNICEDIVSTFEVIKDNKKFLFSIIMDGASNLGNKYLVDNKYTLAEWYVSFVIEKLNNYFKENPTINVKETLKNVIRDIKEEMVKIEEKNKMKLKEYEKPSASIGIIRTSDETTEVYLLGDIETIVVNNHDGVGRIYNPNQVNIQKLDKEVIKKMIKISKDKKCNVIDTMNDEIIINLLQNNRSKMNNDCADGYYICGMSISFIDHLIYYKFNNKDIKLIMIMTDGFNYKMLNMNMRDLYNTINKKGIEFVSKRIRFLEDKDKYCNKYPRFKVHDDLSIILHNIK